MRFFYISPDLGAANSSLANRKTQVEAVQSKYETGISKLPNVIRSNSNLNSNSNEMLQN